MKKQSGFTLIELLVAMAVLGLIMGAMVHLFGSSVTSLHVGARQEVVYEEARLLMNELKTTLRYADSINPQNPDDKTTILSYSGTMWNRHMDIGAADADNISYDITVEWLDAGGGLKQLKVIRTDKTKNGSKRTKEIHFPNDSANSLFKGDSAFPITSESIKLKDGNSVIMYKIALPVQYEFNGQMKTQTLETKVVPSKDEVTETPEEKMRREYMEILNIGLKLDKSEAFTQKERDIYDKLCSYWGITNNGKYSWQFGSNTRIRAYIYEKIYQNLDPSISLDGVNGYFSPACFDFSSGNNVVIIHTKNPKWSDNWNTNYIYNSDDKKWRHLISDKGVTLNTDQFAPDKKPSWEDVKSVITGTGWEIVQEVKH